MGDVDLFALAPGGGLTVNAKWLQHLQERLLGEDGHPRKVGCAFVFVRCLPPACVQLGAHTRLLTLPLCSFQLVLTLP